MKGLILAAGRGTRLRPLTHTRPKPVIRVAGRPIIHYALENLKNAGVREVGVVVSPDTHGDVRAALNGVDGVEVAYIVQQEPQGLAQTLGAALSQEIPHLIEVPTDAQAHEAARRDLIVRLGRLSTGWRC
jgi:glucose-1-phosphate thymidylyltransferase